MKKLAPIFNGEKPSGVYRFGSRATSASILATVEEHGWRGFHVDGRQVRDKASFIKGFAAALSFPGYHSQNWDAFEDCVTDMAWLPAPGYVVLYDQARHLAFGNKTDWRMAQTILTDAAAYWQSRDKPMVVLLRQTWWTAWDVEKI